ncbi:hypothetical protein D3C75_674660 [compost metagenome]
MQVFLGPGDHPLGRIHMAHFCACTGAGHCGAARIGEQVQHLDGPSGVLDFVHHPLPVHLLLGEQPRMLEAGGFDDEFQVSI